MEETVPFYARVPKSLVLEIRRMVYAHKYKNGEKEGVIYNFIKKNPELTLPEIRWQLQKHHKIRRSLSGLKKIAEWCDLPYNGKE